jgi:tripartite-type tricarboxylate transporter receptor subunit TctC
MSRQFLPVLLAALALPLAAPAQQYPSRPIRIVVPFSLGTGIDIIGRKFSEKVQQRLGVAAPVENPLGMSGLLGAEMVSRAPADGHTLLVTANSICIIPHLYPQSGFNPTADLTPLGIVSLTSSTLIARPKAKFSTLRDLIAAAKANPGKISFASSGVGSSSHFRLEEFQVATGTQFLHVPYKSTAAAMTDVIGGHVDVSLLSTGTIHPAVQAGQLKAVATATTKRHRLSPDVPTFAEEGISGFLEDGWFGFLAPKGLPPALATRVSSEIRSFMDLPDVRAALEAAGQTIFVTTPAEMQQTMTGDLARYGALIRKLNIKTE